MTGTMDTIAGTGDKGYAGDGGPAVDALLREPFMCELDAGGNLYIAEATNHCVRRVDAATGVISTVAGSGTLGFGGDGGPATDATMNEPYALQIEGNGDVYIVDRLNAAIRKVDAATGIITTLAGGPDSDTFVEPNDCFLDGAGGPKRRTGDGGPALEASLFGARAVCLDSTGMLYICEREGNGIRKVDTDGVMTTFAGTGAGGYDGDGGPALTATWGGPKAIR